MWFEQVSCFYLRHLSFLRLSLGFVSHQGDDTTQTVASQEDGVTTHKKEQEAGLGTRGEKGPGLTRRGTPISHFQDAYGEKDARGLLGGPGSKNGEILVQQNP